MSLIVGIINSNDRKNYGCTTIYNSLEDVPQGFSIIATDKSPDEVRGDVWLAVINGTNGIVYLPPETTEVQKEMELLNKDFVEYADIFTSPSMTIEKVPERCIGREFAWGLDTFQFVLNNSPTPNSYGGTSMCPYDVIVVKSKQIVAQLSRSPARKAVQQQRTATTAPSEGRQLVSMRTCLQYSDGSVEWTPELMPQKEMKDDPTK